MKADPKKDAQLSVQLMSDPRLLAGVRAMISHAAVRFGFSELECNQIGLAIDEALCNVINHGYERRMDGPIWLSAMFKETQNQTPPSAVFLIEDLAKQVDPTTIRSRDLAEVRPGGLGVYIINEVMDDVSYAMRSEGGMSLTMCKQGMGNQAQKVSPSMENQKESQHQHE